MSPDKALALYRDHCQPGDRGALERYGEKAAVAAILAAVNPLVDALTPFSTVNPHKSESGALPILVPATVADVRNARAALLTPSSETRR